MTNAFCKAFNLSAQLVNPLDDSTGDYGIFDSTFWRLQVILTSVEKDTANTQLYRVAGASMLRKRIKPFAGIIHIDTARKYDRNYAFSQDTCEFHDSPQFRNDWNHRFVDKNIEFAASFIFFEDSMQKGNGYFSGKLTFCLTLDSTNKLKDEMAYWEGLNSPANFVYNGSYTQYGSKKSTWVKWSPMAIDELRGSCEGTGNWMMTWLPNCNYPALVKRGWKTSEAGQLAFDPKLWWKKKN